SVTWTPTYVDAGTYTVTVQDADGNGAVAQSSFTVNVTNNPSGPPVVIQRADTTIAEAVTSNIGIAAFGSGNQSNLRWSLLAPVPPWASLSGTSGPVNSLILKPGFASAESTGSDGVGKDYLRVRVRDGVGANSPSDTMTF